MPSRREQIQSYQYLMQRVVNAFVSGEADPSMSPTRRLAGAGFASVMVSVLVLAVFGVIGLIKHGGNTSWKDNNAIVIEKETGTRFVYRDGVLYPVANYASAVLVIGQPATTVTVSRESLVGATRGPLIGIAGAPDSVPPSGRLLRDAWAVCTQNGHDNSGGTTVTSLVLVGRTPGGGHPLGDAGVIVRDAAGQKSYLIWNGHRFLLANAKVLAALGIDQQPKLLVDGAWLNTVPSGAQIVQPTLDGRGKASTVLRDFLVGQVLTATSGGTTNSYLVRDKDLLPITAVQQALILADEATAAAYPNASPAAKQVQPAEVANAPKAAVPTATPLDAPAQVPAMTSADAAGTICSTFADGQADPKFVVNADAQPDNAGIATNGSSTDQVATRVVVPAGSGAVVRSAASADTDSGTVFLITDQGRRYPLPNAAALAWFGYGSIKPIVLPSTVIARVPAGPGLDPRLAQRPLTG